MRVTLTGASGLIGTKLVQALKARGDDVTVLSRSPASTTRALGVPADAWQPTEATAPATALAGRDAVVHLAGERVDQRWTDEAKRAIAESREAGTRNLVEGLRAADPRPAALISSSAVGYYGPRGDETVDEATPPGTDFLAGRVRRLGARGAARGGARHARRARAHRRRARQGRRRARADADPVQARRRRPRRGRRPVHAVDPRRRPRRHLPRRDRRRDLDRPGQRQRAGARDERGVLQGAGARAAPSRRRSPSPASRCTCSTARWPRS